MDIFGESFLYKIVLFLKANVQKWKMFLGLLNSKYFLGMLDIPYIFGVKSRCWIQAYVLRKIESMPHGVRHSNHLSY